MFSQEHVPLEEEEVPFIEESFFQKFKNSALSIRQTLPKANATINQNPFLTFALFEMYENFAESNSRNKYSILDLISSDNLHKNIFKLINEDEFV